MINIFETSISDNSSDFLHSVGDFTSILSLVPLVIFVWLAIRIQKYQKLSTSNFGIHCSLHYRRNNREQ